MSVRDKYKPIPINSVRDKYTSQPDPVTQELLKPITPLNRQESLSAWSSNNSGRPWESLPSVDKQGLQEAWVQDNQQNLTQKAGNVISQAASGLGNTLTGVGKTIYGGTGLNIINPFDTRSLEEKSTDAISGVNQAVSGVFEIASSPLAASPGLQKILSLPFEAGHELISNSVSGLGVDPNSEQGKLITDSIFNGLMIAGGVSGKVISDVKSGKMTVQDAWDTVKKLPNEIPQTVSDIKADYNTKIAPKKMAVISEKLFDLGLSTSKNKKSLEGQAGTVESFVDAVNKIVQDKSNLKFYDKNGNLVEGKLPSNVGEAIGLVAPKIQEALNVYKGLEQKATEMGATIQKEAIINHLKQQHASSLSGAAGNVGRKTYTTLIKEISGLKPDPVEIGKYMQQKTAEIKTLYKNGSGAQSPKVQAIADTLVKLREEADKAISASVGQDYQAWKNQYGQYKEAAEGLMKIFNKKNNSFGGRFADIISLEQLARGVATLEPNLVTGAAVIKGAQKFGSWLFGNDKAIKDVFNVIDKYGAKAAGKDIKVPFNEPFTMPGKQNKFDLSGKNLPKQLEAPAPGAETFSPLEMPGRIMPPAEVKVVPKKKVIIKKK